mmetsp:Transcript_986/g.1528  ORF Transcript_986/g.1528 Transcript_986/m.1528 type:complete len:428 (+) Transcript_986:93-1376(+)
MPLSFSSPTSNALTYSLAQNKRRTTKSICTHALQRSILLLFLTSGLRYSYADISPALTPTTCPLSKKSKKNIIVSGGLINLGNTCYLNAQLECAYHIPKVRNFILDPTQDQNYGDDSGDSTSLGLQSLQQVFQSMHTASQRGGGDPLLTPSTSTSIFCRNLGINVYEQQDSQEFWKLLLPELNYGPLTDLYRGQYESYIAALDGSGRERKRQEVFLDLSVDVSNFDDVHDSLEDMFTSGEVLSVKEGNGWRPEKGADKVDALKGYTIRKSGLPKLLQLHLMRFRYDMMSGGMSKINDRFTFSKELDLTQICKEGQESREKVIFDLQSVVIHAGEYGRGHYYSYVRPDVLKNKWYRYDDDRVTEVSFKTVKEDAFGGQAMSPVRKQKQNGFWGRLVSRRKTNYGWGGKSSSAYMLQYVKRSEISILYG